MRQALRTLTLYAFHMLFARPVLRWVAGVRYRRRNLVPRGPCLVVSNHNSHLDAGVLMGLFPLRRLAKVHPVAAADYFGSSLWLRTLAMLCMNGIPIERRPKAGIDPLSPLVDRLGRGETLIFFPEGSRGEAGVVAPFRAGVGRLVRQVPGLLVVPVFLAGPERIWPRGQVLPVPLTVDAFVGKPRSYSHLEDPREIADQVRRDVISLAPPPPPVPGARPTPPVRIAVCGVDPAARRRAYHRVCEHLGRVRRTRGLGDPPFEAEAGELREVERPLPFAPGRAWHGMLAWIFRTAGRFKGQRFAEMIERAQVDEALEQSPGGFVVTEGSALVDLMAWADADFYRGRFGETELHRLMQYLDGTRKIPFSHGWRLVRKAPEIWLIHTFGLVRPPVPDVVILVQSDVTAVLEQLRLRGEELRSDESEEGLTALIAGYRHVSAILKRRRKVEVIEFDANGPVESLVEAIEACCRERLDNEAATHPGR